MTLYSKPPLKITSKGPTAYSNLACINKLIVKRSATVLIKSTAHLLTYFQN